MIRLIAVMISALVITVTTISSALGVNPRMGGGSLHGFKIQRDGAWGSRLVSGITMSPSHPLYHKCSPVKVCRVLNKQLSVNKRC